MSHGWAATHDIKCKLWAWKGVTHFIICLIEKSAWVTLFNLVLVEENTF